MIMLRENPFEDAWILSTTQRKCTAKSRKVSWFVKASPWECLANRQSEGHPFKNQTHLDVYQMQQSTKISHVAKRSSVAKNTSSTSNSTNKDGTSSTTISKWSRTWRIPFHKKNIKSSDFLAFVWLFRIRTIQGREIKQVISIGGRPQDENFRNTGSCLLWLLSGKMRPKWNAFTCEILVRLRTTCSVTNTYNIQVASGVNGIVQWRGLSWCHKLWTRISQLRISMLKNLYRDSR